METSSIQKAEAEQVFNLDEQELYSMLVPAHVRTQVYSKDGLIARGHEIFVSKMKQLKGSICEVYKKKGTNVKNSIDLTVIVGAGLMGSPLMAGIPVLPMAALLVKMGLEQLCSDKAK